MSFQEALCETISKHPELLTDVQVGWDDPKWEELSGLITDTDLDQTGMGTAQAEQIFASVFQTSVAVPRQRKRLERIAVKRQRTTYGGRFKAMSDLVAYRIFCKVPYIAEVIKEIAAITSQHDGVTVIRNPITTPDGIYTDIVQYVFVYIPAVRFVIEFQIGHPFAAYTFSIDSHLRDHPEDTTTVSMWTNDYYQLVQSYILSQANKQDVPVSKEDIAIATEALFLPRVPTSIPEELFRILHRWLLINF